MSQANRAHLARPEAGNVVMSIKTKEDAERSAGGSHPREQKHADGTFSRTLHYGLLCTEFEQSA